jgi:hypothetical protein
MKNCPQSDREISEAAKKCPYCLNDVETKTFWHKILGLGTGCESRIARQAALLRNDGRGRRGLALPLTLCYLFVLLDPVGQFGG